MSQQHREALAHLMYGAMDNGGFVLLTGEIGTGKTTLCRCFLQQLPAEYDVALVLNPKLSVLELLATICEELSIPVPADAGQKSYIDSINSHLLASHAQGRSTLLIIDEAQNLDSEVLEQVRLLTNLETDQRKLLHIFLLGQPELRDKLAQPALQQLSQRIVSRYHLGPLSQEEVTAYVSHRLLVANCSRTLFPPQLLPLLHRYSGGIPRKLNLLCDRALLGCYVAGRNEVSKTMLRTAAQEVFDDHAPRSLVRRLAIPAAILCSATAIASTLLYRQLAASAPPVTAVPASARPAAAPHPVSQTVPRLSATLPPLANLAAARQALLQHWQLPANFTAEADFCPQAALAGLACFGGKADLPRLRQLNLPVVLQLQAAGGNGYLLLEQITGNALTLNDGKQRHASSAQALSPAWQGEFQLLWRPPPAYHTPLARGSRGMSVAWLWQRLGPASIDHNNDKRGPLFDSQLEQLVRNFQQQAGVPADGIAGPLTLILLAGRGQQTASPRLGGGIPPATAPPA
ncbi:ExeA family protein [Vogesella sp. LIG4]|uniref:ExeA family protein n=1 Tax=Vogesella sp. LIG4 TaxID=1192162 RepID=UPI001E493B0C|nr:ExeA family protein [Vogesella sp. LIG4]